MVRLRPKNPCSARTTNTKRWYSGLCVPRFRLPRPFPSDLCMLVHCSAGVGRTGTFIAIDHAQQLLQSESKIDLIQLIKELREDRVAMVQTTLPGGARNLPDSAPEGGGMRDYAGRAHRRAVLSLWSLA